jgi:hypothetical protein
MSYPDLDRDRERGKASIWKQIEYYAMVLGVTRCPSMTFIRLKH